MSRSAWYQVLVREDLGIEQETGRFLFLIEDFCNADSINVVRGGSVSDRATFRSTHGDNRRGNLFPSITNDRISCSLSVPPEEMS